MAPKSNLKISAKMKKRLFLALVGVIVSAIATADSWRNMDAMKLEVPEMKPELNYAIHQPLTYYEQRTFDLPSQSVSARPEAKMDFDFFKSKTNPGVKPYSFLDDVTFVGVPVFLAGVVIKGEKNNFKQDSRTKASLMTNFKTRIDDYTQFFGPLMTVGLKVGGVEGRSDWPRLVTSSLASYAFMAAFVNGIKYTASEMRPDGSTRNSWPSGHTATSFVGATILHKEYGLTRSPWYSVAGYSVATATGVMRILNNRHWISDVLSGAGIGIMSTELGYFVGDALFKDRGLLRNDHERFSDKPSFFSIGMGMGFGLKSLNFGVEDITYAEDAEDFSDGVNFGVDFHTASVVDAEGAYFFNKYVGVGGRLRVRAMTAKSWSDFIGRAREDRVKISNEILNVIDSYSLIPTDDIKKELQNVCTDEEYTVESDHLTEFSASVGMYFNVPLGERFALGSKLLIGRTMTQELDINAVYKGDVKNVGYLMTLAEGLPEPTGISLGVPIEGTTVPLDVENGPMLFVQKFESANKDYEQEWDYLTMGGNNSTNYGTGLSLTYKYKSNFSWRVYVDYDYSHKEFTLTYDPYRFMKLATPNLESVYHAAGTNLDPYQFKKKKDVHYFTIGGSFLVTF